MKEFVISQAQTERAVLVGLITQTQNEQKTQEYLDELQAARDGLAAANAEAFEIIIKKLDEAIAAFISYNVYY